MCYKLITFQDWKGKIGFRDKSGVGVYASISYFLVLNVPALTEEVNNVLCVYVPAHTTLNMIACEECLSFSYETHNVRELPIVGYVATAQENRKQRSV